MARVPKLAWMMAATLMVAACGGGDDANADLGAVASDADTSTETDGVGDDSDVASDDDASGDTDNGGDSTGSDAGLGPALEPVAQFTPPAAAQVGTSVAVSPTGDRVAVMWIDESDFATNLAVYDAETGGELVSIVDDRLDGDMFWASDDRLITAGNFAKLWAWDSATLQPVSEEPLSDGENDCAGGNGTVFDPVSGALFMKSDGLCRIDVTTGAFIEYASENRTTLLAVAIGGNEVYLRGTDDAGDLVMRVLDATTLDVISDEPSNGPNPVVAASGNGLIEKENGGFGYLVQPSGQAVDFDTAGITTSAAGGYYVARFDGGGVVISSSDGNTVGTTGGHLLQAAWSADDKVLVTRTEDGVSVYHVG